MRGFLGTRADLLSDLLLVALALILPALGAGVRLARRRSLAAHRAVMLGIFSALVLYVVLYEANLAWLGGVAYLLRTTPMAPSRYGLLVAAHVTLGAAALVLGAFVVRLGAKALSAVGPKGAIHRKLAWWEVGTLGASALSGLVVYWVTFVMS